MKVYQNPVHYSCRIRIYFLFFTIASYNISAVAQMSTKEDVGSKKIFIRASISRQTCVVGEALILTYKLYSTIKAKSEILQMPRFNAFTTSEIDKIESLNPVFELVQGQRFEVYEIKKLLLTPDFAGRLVVDPMEIEHVMISQAHQAPDESQAGNVGDLLDQLSDAQNSQLKYTRFKSYSNQLEIEVTELPSSDSSGIQSTSVGNFAVYGNLKSKKVFSNEAFVVTITIKGKGNLMIPHPPEINFPAGTKVIAVQESENKAARSASLNTVRRFDYTVSTAQVGTFVIPGVEFAYFDPVAREYKSTKSKPVEVLVEASRIPDIIPPRINADSKQPPVIKAVVPKWKYKGYQMIPLFIILIGLIIITTTFIRNARKTSKNALYGRNWIGWTRSNAIKVEANSTSLVKIQKMFDSNDFSMFYHELYCTIWQSISDKLNVRPIEQYKLNILALLRKSGWKNEEIAELDDILDRCAWNLYVPDPENNKSYTEIYERSRRVLQRLEQDSPVAS